jgi:hypothetical protein
LEDALCNFSKEVQRLIDEILAQFQVEADTGKQVVERLQPGLLFENAGSISQSEQSLIVAKGNCYLVALASSFRTLTVTYPAIRSCHLLEWSCSESISEGAPGGWPWISGRVDCNAAEGETYCGLLNIDGVCICILGSDGLTRLSTANQRTLQRRQFHYDKDQRVGSIQDSR